MGQTLRPIETRAEGPRARVAGFLGGEQRAPSPSASGYGKRCKLPQRGPERSPGKFGFWNLRNHVRTVSQLLNLGGGQQENLGAHAPCPNVDPPLVKTATDENSEFCNKLTAALYQKVQFRLKQYKVVKHDDWCTISDVLLVTGLLGTATTDVPVTMTTSLATSGTDHIYPQIHLIT